MKKFIQSIPVVFFLISTLGLGLAEAGVTYVPIAQCELGSDKVYVSLMSDRLDGPFPEIGVAMRENALAAQQPDFYPVKVHLESDGSYFFDFVGYAQLPDMGRDQCKPMGLPEHPERDEILRLTTRSHFVPESYDWNDPRSLAELEDACIAIPLDVNYLCGHTPDATGPFFCNWIELTDEIMPVETDCQFP